MKRVKAKWIMHLPTGSQVLAKSGDKVVAGEVVAKYSEVAHESIDFSGELGKLKNNLWQDLTKRLPLMLQAGEVLIKKNGWFGRSVTSPVSGELVKIDEFGNLIYRVGTGEINEIRTPVGGSVVRSEKNLLAIGFAAIEYNGEGGGEGKKWGGGLVKVEKVSEINSSLEGKIVITTNTDPVVFMRAEAVGVVGLILERMADYLTDLPVFVPEAGEFEKIWGLENVGQRRVLLNSIDGRLLIAK